MIVANERNAADTARAFATYALVPYLGILFCPGALLMGGVSLINDYRFGENSSSSSIAILLIASVELVAQVALWWIMYQLPEWSRAI